MKKRLAALVLFVPWSLVACAAWKGCGSRSSDAHREKLATPITSFPCADAAVATDPNNCGTCGTICGSYGQNSGAGGVVAPGVSFIQGSCARSVCNPYPVILTEYADGGSILFDCFDLNNGSVVNQAANPPNCISILTSPGNCGGLGYQCNGECQNGKCAGFLTVPTPLVYGGPSSITSGGLPETISVSGGTPPYAYTFAPNGNPSGLRIVGNKVYPGSAVATNFIEVIDSAGNFTIGTITQHL